MDKSGNRFLITIASLIIIAIFLFATGLVGIASAAGQTKLDIAVYKTINPQGNPIKEMPNDDTVFNFLVMWVHTTVTSSGRIASKEVYYLGVFSASQNNTLNDENGWGYFPEINGSPFEQKTSICYYYIPYTDICAWFDPGIEKGEYIIEPYNVPSGYCPQFKSQNRAKDTNPSDPDKTTTVDEKFYMGAYCGTLYPGYYGGNYGTGQCAPNKCYIKIQ